MILWDIILRRNNTPFSPRYGEPNLVAKVPNGTRLPNNDGLNAWERRYAAISPDEAEYILNTQYADVTRAKNENT